MIATVVEHVGLIRRPRQNVVLLKEANGDRRLPIAVGGYEAAAIALALKGIPTPRPLPYDLMQAMIAGLGGAVDRVLVAALAHDEFSARIVVRDDGRVIELDARPGDAIALAVRAGVPILVDEAVLERTGFTPRVAGARGREATRVQDQDRFSAFRDFIGTLDLDGLGEERRT